MPTSAEALSTRQPDAATSVLRASAPLRSRRNRLASALPYVVAVLCAVVFFRSSLFDGRLLGDLRDARWTMAIHEHWFDVWRSDAPLRDLMFFFPFERTLGMSDAFLVQGQFHALGRLLGLGLAPAWVVANICFYIVGALGVATLSGLILRTPAFRCAFVACACLSYPLLVTVEHPQMLGFLSVSWLFVGWLQAVCGRPRGVFLLLLTTPLLALSSWYAAILGGLVLVTYIAFRALLAPRTVLSEWTCHLSNALLGSLRSWLGRMGWVLAGGLWTLVLWTYLPARSISPAVFTWIQVTDYLPRLSDLVNASAGGGGIWSRWYARGFDPTPFDSERVLGFTPLLLLALTIVAAATLRALAVPAPTNAQTSGRERWNSRAAAQAAAMATVALIAALLVVDERGISGYRVLFALVPGFEAVRSPMRVQVLLYALAIFAVLSVLEGWCTHQTRRRARFSAVLPWAISVIAGAALLMDMYRPTPTTWAADEWLPPALQSQVMPVARLCDSFVLDAQSFPDEPDELLAIDAVLLSMLSGVPTAHGYSRASPIDHPGFLGPPDAMVTWMRAQGYDGNVCLVSPDRITVLSSRVD